MTAARLLPLLLMFALDAVPLEARADDAACQAVLQSVIKQAAVPVHQKITIESAAAPGKPIQSETIHLGDTLYLQIQGRWMTRPYDAARAAQDARQAMAKAEHTCTRVRSESTDNPPSFSACRARHRPAASATRRSGSRRAPAWRCARPCLLYTSDAADE